MKVFFVTCGIFIGAGIWGANLDVGAYGREYSAFIFMEDGRGIFFGAWILYFVLCSTLSPHIKINRINAFDQKYE